MFIKEFRNIVLIEVVYWYKNIKRISLKNMDEINLHIKVKKLERRVFRDGSMKSGQINAAR